MSRISFLCKRKKKEALANGNATGVPLSSTGDDIVNTKSSKVLATGCIGRPRDQKWKEVMLVKLWTNRE